MDKCEKCKYSSISKCTGTRNNITCGYMLYTGHVRGCSVADCEHWKEDSGRSKKEMQRRKMNEWDEGLRSHKKHYVQYREL